MNEDESLALSEEALDGVARLQAYIQGTYVARLGLREFDFTQAAVPGPFRYRAVLGFWSGMGATLDEAAKAMLANAKPFLGAILHEGEAKRSALVATINAVLDATKGTGGNSPASPAPAEASALN